MVNGLTTDVGISTTGIAGPDGGSQEKPVGLVYIGIKVKEKVVSFKFNFTGDREKIRKKAVLHSLFELYKILEEDIPFICEQYDKLAAEMVKRHGRENDFNFFHFMIDLTGGPCVYKRLSGCGSGTEYLAVTPWGDLYPCHQFVGNEKFLMGNVWDGVRNEELRDEFKCCNVYAKEKCQKCFAKFYCSGGCAANSYNFHGSINDAYDIGCELQRKRVECAIMIKAATAEQGE